MIHALSLSGLSVTRGERVLFRNVDFGLKAGEAAVLTGANGAGKSTIFKAIMGFVPVARGEIEIRDDRIAITVTRQADVYDFMAGSA